jgi:hypothetical protein
MTMYQLGYAYGSEELPCEHGDDPEFSAGWHDAHRREDGLWVMRWNGDRFILVYEPGWGDIISEVDDEVMI